MTRTVNLEHRADLLDRISDYVVEHGLADLSLRPLAKAVGSSPRTLLYHFGSKAAIVARVLEGVRARQMLVFDALRGAGATTPRTICEAAFAYMTDPAIFPKMRLFFETYALALRDPNRFPRFIEGAVKDWLDFLSASLIEEGASPEDASAMATVTLALYRGLMLDLAATNDCARVERALVLAVSALESLAPDKANRNV